MHDTEPTLSASMNREAQPETAALFVSDVHLHAQLPQTTAAFLAFLHGPARCTRQLFLLGDLFEYWAGDDDLEDDYNRRILQAFRAVSDAGVAVFWLGGNRDFLAGQTFARAAGLTLLPDPVVIDIGGKRIVLTHGDAQCTDDLAYMAFREQVRQPAWQQTFLATPLAQRKALIAQMRAGSREAQKMKASEIMDVNEEAIRRLFEQSAASIMIHGHTHRPACHRYDHPARIRYVLPDWDCEMVPPRGGWLEIDLQGEIHLREPATGCTG